MTMPTAPTYSFSQTLHGIRAALQDAVRVALNLYKVMIPIIIGVKILMEYDLIHYLALPLKPLMGLMGLPADLGLAWAFAMIVNIYTGLIVLAGMASTLPPLTIAQTTTFATVVLIAHGLILESKISQQCGVSFAGQFTIRLVGGLLCGMLMHALYTATGTLQEPAHILLQATGPDPDMIQWALGEISNLGIIFLIIAALMCLQRALAHSHFDRVLDRCFAPLLTLLGISPKAATCVAVGFSMGLLYGSGVIIKESQANTLSHKDIFCAITLLGLAHALIEDTLLMLLINGHMSGVLGIRLLFALCFSFIITRVYTWWMEARA